MKTAFDVVMVRSNAVVFDPRVMKISHSLATKYNVIILGWNRESLPTSSLKIEERIFAKLLPINAPWNRVTLVFYYPLFWLWVFFNLMYYRPKFVHAFDLEGVIPCYLYKLLSRSVMIFDSSDRFAMAAIPIKYRLLYALVNQLENSLAKASDALMTVSKERLSTFQNYLPPITEIVMNCPDDVDNILNQKNSPNQSGLNIVYAGMIIANRGLFLLNSAIKKIPRANLLLAGRIMDKSLETLIKNPQISYSGVLTPRQALAFQANADVIPLLYDPDIPINKVANPNKLFEAMMLGKPVISNICSDIVEKEGCGIVVDYNTDDVRKGLLMLNDAPALRKSLGENGRRAFLSKYNWKLMEKKLFAVYDQLSASHQGPD